MLKLTALSRPKNSKREHTKNNQRQKGDTQLTKETHTVSQYRPTLLSWQKH